MLQLPVAVTEAVEAQADPQTIWQIMQEELDNFTTEAARPAQYWSLLMSMAVHHDHYDLLKDLLNKGYDVNDRENFGISWPMPLNVALLGKKDTKFIELLLNAGADVNTRANGTITIPLQIYIAIEIPMFHDDVDMLQLLIPRYYVSKKVERSRLLHYACQHGAMNCLQFLLKRANESDINSINEGRSTPLMYATRHGADMVRMLIDNGADVHAINKSGMTALHMAVRQLGGRALVADHLPETIKVLLDAGADVNATDSQGFTLFSLICAQSQRHTWQSFKQLEDLHILDINRKTVLKTLDLLLDRGVNIKEGKNNFVRVINTSLKSVIRNISSLSNANMPIMSACIISALNLISAIYEKGLQTDDIINMVDEDGHSVVDALFKVTYDVGGVLRSYCRENWYEAFLSALGTLLETHLNHGGHIARNLSQVCHLYLLCPEQHDKLLTVMWQSLDERSFRGNVRQLTDVSCDEVNTNLSEEIKRRDCEDIIEKYSKNTRSLREISRSTILSLLKTPPKHTASFLPGPKGLASQVLCSVVAENY